MDAVVARQIFFERLFCGDGDEQIQLAEPIVRNGEAAYGNSESAGEKEHQKNDADHKYPRKNARSDNDTFFLFCRQSHNYSSFDLFGDCAVCPSILSRDQLSAERMSSIYICIALMSGGVKGAPSDIISSGCFGSIYKWYL